MTNRKKIGSLYKSATQFLGNLDVDWARLIKIVGPCTLQATLTREPYEALVRAVAYQQLHARAGDAIMARFLNHYTEEFPAADKLLEASVDELRACGFSGRKAETIHGIAEGLLQGIVPSRAEAEALSDEELIKRLVVLKGIGPWTVEMLLIFTLARTDILPADDFGVRDGYRRLKSLDTLPTKKTLATLGEAWRPYRTIAAWYLWRVPR